MRSNNTSGGWVIGLIAAALIVVLLIGRSGFSLLKPVITFAFIAAAVLFVLVIGGTIYAICSGYKEKRKSAVGRLNKEDAVIIEEAQKDLDETQKALKTVSDQELRAKGMTAYASAKKTVEEIIRQPEEIRRASQFFNYYIPTFKTVVLKYLVLQNSGENTEEYIKKVFNHFDTLNKAFGRQYSALFENDKLDLTVETKALEAALKRDGLLDQ